MNNTITLYHGTTHDFAAIDVTRGKPFKDFGKGFYATQSYEHAVSIAERNQRIERERLNEVEIRRDVKIYVYSYSLQQSDLDKLNVKRFDSPDTNWVDFVVHNRSDSRARHDYDLVIGATANDDTRITIQNYLLGNFGEPGSDSAVAIFLQLIKAEKLPTQWLFATQRATNLLKFEKRVQLL
ncbi:MAG: DUF3990 domain-containing protein [Clostridiales bacterium]|jgi:hypothetical protein|nr:DUF3990 domain-containing protein [Clostridiales bacterium]